MIWFQSITPEDLIHLDDNTMARHLGIEYVEIGDDYLVGRMPIDGRSVQPFRMMHGGASAALAETLGSLGSVLTVDPSRYRCVGLSLNISHIRAIPEGGVAIGTARPFHLGRTTQVWDIQIVDEREKLVSVARLTTAVIDGSKSR